jgi:hypothetical protein
MQCIVPYLREIVARSHELARQLLEHLRGLVGPGRRLAGVLDLVVREGALRAKRAWKRWEESNQRVISD